MEKTTFQEYKKDCRFHCGDTDIERVQCGCYSEWLQSIEESKDATISRLTEELKEVEQFRQELRYRKEYEDERYFYEQKISKLTEELERVTKQRDESKCRSIRTSRQLS